jgi:hypothetical protein
MISTLVGSSQEAFPLAPPRTRRASYEVSDASHMANDTGAPTLVFHLDRENHRENHRPAKAGRRRFEPVANGHLAADTFPVQVQLR